MLRNKIAPVLISILIIAGVFYTGLYVGEKKAPAVLSVEGLSNKETNRPESVDFDLFWRVWNLLNEKYVSSGDPIKDQERVYGAIQGLAQSLGDPYTTFLPPAETEVFEGDVGGSFAGVGMEITTRDRFVTVIAPLKDSPAEKAGIKTGDRVISVDGDSVAGLSIERVVSMIRGERGKEVVITILREGEDHALDISVIRDTIQIPTIETEIRSDGVFVISLFNFSALSPQFFRSALREYSESGLSDLVVDLRGNPGGFLSAAIDISSYFLPTGHVVVLESTGERETEKIHRSRGYNVFSGNLVILVDGGSASASEIVAGALKDHGVATIVGTQTFGKGSVQEFLKVTDDTSLKVTIARWLTPDRISISEGGLSPDVVVEFNPMEFENGVDTQLEKAVEILLRN